MYNSVTQNWHFKLSDTISPILLAIGIFALKKVIELTTNKFTKGLKFQTEAERKKLPDSIFCVLVYGGLWLWEAKIVFEYDFFMNPAGCFTNWSDERLKKTPPSVNWLYVTVLGFYFEELFSCVMISKFQGLLTSNAVHSDEKRKDTNVMILHHICTIFLVTFSLGMRFWQIGCLVLFCHDCCDVFLDLAKMFNYMQNRKDISKTTSSLCEVCATIGFIAFVVSWIVFRFVFYPKKALWSVLYHRYDFW